jgi:hypothetical protein
MADPVSRLWRTADLYRGSRCRHAGAFQRVATAETQSRKAFLERLSALDQIRAQIYLSGTYVRDFLLSPDPDTAKAQAAHLATLGTRDPRRPGRLRARPGARGTPAICCAAQRDRRLLGGARCDRGVVAAERDRLRLSVLLSGSWFRGARPCCKSPTASPR